MRAAFLGSPAFAVPSLRALAAEHTVPLVVTQPDRPSGRGRSVEPTAVRRAADELGLAVRTWEKGGRAGIEAALRELDLDVMVVVAFGIILRPSTLAIPRRGAVNVHASILPRWRGVAPIERAIQAADAETGVTLMVIDAGVDTGPILDLRRVPIAPDDTRVSLAAKLAHAGAALLADRLPEYAAGRLEPRPQPETGITYAPRLEKREGRIDWTQPARALDAHVRAFYDWPGAVTDLGGLDLKVHAARAVGAEAAASPGTVRVLGTRGPVQVACGTDALRLEIVQLAGKPRVAAIELVRGRVLRDGMHLGTVST